RLTCRHFGRRAEMSASRPFPTAARRSRHVGRPPALRHGSCVAPHGMPTTGRRWAMGIVRLALRRPYTFIVMAMLIAIGGVLTIARTPVDIFPEINIPVVSVIWQYNGLLPAEVEGRMVTISERAMTTTVNSIEHIESQSLSGVGLIRVFFHPDASIRAA